ncbi:GNAT family N-acetyltransferase [Demetria terragena]|uniref:GNAT family N-acetyltransferase n=1 Tax=Demetria terragena TaxID=63959 RepID=UPI000373F2A0|nr:GNAT family N-acetyltransferase [Demetria terragena]
MGADLPPGYTLHAGPPTVDDFIRLRRDAGLTPPSREQAELGINGAWYAVHVLHTESTTTVAMGRVLGDGGTAFHVTDMAVDPAHQRRGLGDAILTALMGELRAKAPSGAYISLMADPPGQGLYLRHGFVRSTPTEGMSLRLGHT